MARRRAPPVAEELSHPLPGPAGGLAHGQTAVPPTPGSHKLVKPDAERSRTKTSDTPFQSPAARLLATEEKATKRPSPPIDKLPSLNPLACAPLVARSTCSVVPVARSRMYMCGPTGGPGATRPTNDTKRPSREIDGQ